MTWQRAPYVIPLILAAAVSFVAALYLWRRHHSRSSRTGIVLLLASAEWVMMYVFEIASVNLSTQIMWDKLQFLGACIIPTAWLVYALQFTGYERWVTRRNIVLLGIIPFATLVLAFTNEIHGLIWSRYNPITYGPFTAKYASFGAAFWIFMVYSYVQVLVGIFFVLQAIVLSGRLYRWQAIATLAIVLLAWLMSALSYIIDIRPLPGLELTPIALSVTAPIMAWSLYRLRRRDIVPVAHDMVIEGMSDGVIVLDSQSRIIDINAAAEHMIGHSRFKAVGLPAGEVWPEWLSQLERIRAGTLSEMTVEQVHERRTYDVRVSPLTNWRGQLISQVIVLRDITERKRAEEEALRRKITEFDSFMNNILDLAWVKDAESRFIAVNKAFSDAVGMDPEFLINSTCEVCFGDEGGKKFREDDRRVMESRRQVIVEEKIIDSKNREIWLETIKSPMFDDTGKVVGTVGIARDITERKEMEDALRESENKYRTIFETTGTATAIVGEDTTIELANSEVEKLFGYAKEELEGKKSWTEFILGEDLERMREYHRLRRSAPNSTPKKYEFRGIDKQGNMRNIFLTVDLIPGTSKSIASLLDITDQKRAIEAVQESESRYRLLAENLTDVIWTMDMNLRYTYISPSIERLRGYTVEEAMVQRLEEVLTPASHEIAMKTFAEALAARNITQNDPFMPRTLELELNCKNGSTIWTEVKMTFLADPKGQPSAILGVTRDITGRKQTEEALRQSEEKLRFLSSHLLSAHETERKRVSKELHDELGQDLIGLKLRLGSIRRKLKEDQIGFIDECESIQNDVDQIIENVRRLSRDLGPYTLEHLGLWASLRWLTEDFARHYNVKTSFDILDSDRALPQETQLNIFRVFQEALTNIQKHAYASNVSIEISETNGSLSFLIEDDGKGFDLTHVMKKSVTEKGLGLVIMEERIRMLGGVFGVWSQDGKGTKISFTVPVNS